MGFKHATSWALAAVAAISLLLPTASAGYRRPVVLSIAPDTVNCDDPDDPDNVEDVQIAGSCFLGSIVAAFLATAPDGSGTPVDLLNVVNVDKNIVTATVVIDDLLNGLPYYVFLVRSDGAVSTTYPNVLGYDVTFTCESKGDPPPPPTLTSCRVVRGPGGVLILQVNGVRLRPNNTVVLLNGTPCRRNKYPRNFVQSDGTTTRINCSGGLAKLLPAVVTTRDSDGTVSGNSLNCDR